jgi:hypothetical protein
MFNKVVFFLECLFIALDISWPPTLPPKGTEKIFQKVNQKLEHQKTLGVFVEHLSLT